MEGQQCVGHGWTGRRCKLRQEAWRSYQKIKMVNGFGGKATPFSLD